MLPLRLRDDGVGGFGSKDLCLDTGPNKHMCSSTPIPSLTCWILWRLACPNSASNFSLSLVSVGFRAAPAPPAKGEAVVVAPDPPESRGVEDGMEPTPGVAGAGVPPSVAPVPVAPPVTGLKAMGLR